MKRSRLALVVILVAGNVLFVALWVGEGPLWRLVMLKVVPIENPTMNTRGWATVTRWRDNEFHRRAVVWDVNTGLRCEESWFFHGTLVSRTTWDHDGSIFRQDSDLEPEPWYEPPWRWGATDQTEPTAPWWGKE